MVEPDTADAPVITDAQIAEYKEKGFVVVEDIFSAEDVR